MAIPGHHHPGAVAADPGLLPRHPGGAPPGTGLRSAHGRPGDLRRHPGGHGRHPLLRLQLAGHPPVREAGPHGRGRQRGKRRGLLAEVPPWLPQHRRRHPLPGRHLLRRRHLPHHPGLSRQRQQSGPALLVGPGCPARRLRHAVQGHAGAGPGHRPGVAGLEDGAGVGGERGHASGGGPVPHPGSGPLHPGRPAQSVHQDGHLWALLHSSWTPGRPGRPVSLLLRRGVGQPGSQGLPLERPRSRVPGGGQRAGGGFLLERARRRLLVRFNLVEAAS